MASPKARSSNSSAKSAAPSAAKPAKASTGSLVTAQLLSQLKNSAQKTSSTQPAALPLPVTPPVEIVEAPTPRAAAYLNTAPTPAPVVVAEAPRTGAHPGGGHARVISITLTPYDLQLCERIRARFQDTTLAPSRSEILKLALHALELDDDGLIEALLAVRERDGRRRKLEPGEQAPAAHYPAAPTAAATPSGR